MNPSDGTKKDRRLWLFAMAACFILAAFLRFALVGYSFTAYILAGIGALIFLFHLLRRLGYTRLRHVLAALVLIGCICFAALELVVIGAARTDRDPEAPYLIVLGAGLNGTAPSLSLVDRLVAARDYLEQYPDAVAIVTGGQGPGELITEAQAMETWLLAQGIAPERILKEERATDTVENITYSLELIAQHGGDPAGRVAIATSEYHLYRAKYIAAHLGAQPLGVAGETSLPVLKVNYFVREAFGVAHLWVFGT